MQRDDLVTVGEFSLKEKNVELSPKPMSFRLNIPLNWGNIFQILRPSRDSLLCSGCCAIVVFLCGVLPWLLLYLENNRPCSHFAPDDGVVNPYGISFFDYNILNISDVVSKDFVLNMRAGNNQTLYILNKHNSVVPFGEFKGELENQISFRDFDALCDNPFDNDSNEVADYGTKFCVRPIGDIVEYSHGVGLDIYFKIYSPFLDYNSFDIYFYTYSKYNFYQYYPEVNFTVRITNSTSRVSHFVVLSYDSYSRGVRYVRNSYFSYDKSFGAVWLGAISAVRRVLTYRSSLPYYSNRLNKQSKLFRLCVPIIKQQPVERGEDFGDTTEADQIYERLFENVQNLIVEAQDLLSSSAVASNSRSELDEILVEIFESVLLSKYISLKVMYQIYGTALYRIYASGSTGSPFG